MSVKTLLHHSSLIGDIKSSSKASKGYNALIPVDNSCIYNTLNLNYSCAVLNTIMLQILDSQLQLLFEIEVNTNQAHQQLSIPLERYNADIAFVKIYSSKAFAIHKLELT
jgi:hypothetical protein